MGAQAVRLSNIDIDNALNNRDFEVLFQPIFDLGNGRISRMETFVRWQHPSLGVLPPGAFISFFESQGRMSELTRYVLDEAMSNYLAWRGNRGPGFSINLALTDISDVNFADHLNSVLQANKFPVKALTLECPMPPVTMPTEQVVDHLTTLRKTGVRLAIEVRGRANDFLRTADPFPFDEIKTGGAAILRFARTVRGPGLSAISELLDIASNANAVITAVGVEDQASLSALRGLGFNAGQGNHLAKVGSLKDFTTATVNAVRQRLDLDDLDESEIQSLDMPQDVQTKTTVENAPSQVDEPQAVEGETSRDAVRSEPVASEGIEQSAQAEDKRISSDKPLTTAERARRKAAALARKKGKDVVKAEIAARRAKLGLSVPEESTTNPIPAARGLQERLTSEFTGEEPSVTTEAEEEQQVHELPQAVGDHEVEIDQSETITETPDENFESRENDDQNKSNLIVEQQTDEIDLSINQPEKASAEGPNTQRVKSDQTEEIKNATNNSSLTDRVGDENMAVETNIDTPELPAQHTISPLDEHTTPSSAREIAAQVVTNSSVQKEGAKHFVDDQKVHQVAEVHRIVLNIENANAYFIECIHVFSDEYRQFDLAAILGLSSMSAQADDQYSNQHAEEDSLILISSDELVRPQIPAHQSIIDNVQEGAPTPQVQSVPRGDALHEDLGVDEVYIPEGASKPDHAPSLIDDQSLPTVSYDDEGSLFAEEFSEVSEVEHEETADQLTDENGAARTPLSITAIEDVSGHDQDTFALEDELLLESQQNELDHISLITRINMMLERKYILWPNHFWPKPWKRAWNRYHENRQFVERVKNRSTVLEHDEEEDDGTVKDELF